ncbi:hypothetical protein HS088_TW15G00671 [Tripterygium wilfordii]|uniref:ArgH n=1 Tax=Tripterygium wilfordii TaxID=458696 RepID=A0A7J7CMC6_TRIWF|nr:hypothetical protein HS088_TW15G00671 [Tripterygium wilfordii]
MLNTTVEELVKGFESEGNQETGDYSRKLVEFCCSKALSGMCERMGDMIGDGSFSRFTFDMMLAWEIPSSQEEEAYTESLGKEKEERRKPTKAVEEQDDISLFYSDIMPLLVDNEQSVGEDAFVWLVSLVPLAADVVNGRFMFETLTATTCYQLHFPAYDMFLKEIDKCIKNLQNQAKPKGVELADDEYILHFDGTATTQRVVRHIGGTSWPGLLTLTNYALYFEASGVVTYEDALKIDLSKDIEHTVKPAATGPWGAPLFDKAIVYESPELSEGITFEFPEITSSTRRDLWLALTKEIMLMHKFLSKYNVEYPTQAWDMHSRTILAIIRLHAGREMLRMSPPEPTKFLIFALFYEVPKGDIVLEELAESLKKDGGGYQCKASSILRSMNISHPVVSTEEIKAVRMEPKSASGLDENISQLEAAVNQAREEAREINVAKATTECLKEEGIGESVLVLMNLLKPLGDMLPRLNEILSWKKPLTTLAVIVTTMLIVYKEWVGKAIAACLLWIVAKMLQARRRRLHEKCNEIVVETGGSDQTMMESIVSAQYGLITVHEIIQSANIIILKIWSIAISKAYKHANMAMAAMCGLAIMLSVIPFKFIIMAAILYFFILTSKLGKLLESDQGNRRLKEWWDSIPIAPVRIEDKDKVAKNI